MSEFRSEILLWYLRRLVPAPLLRGQVGAHGLRQSDQHLRKPL